MKERESKPTAIDDVRTKAKNILGGSSNILEINSELLEKDLVPRLTAYKKQLGESDPYDLTKGMPVETAVGLNLFINVVNFCYQDPDTKHEYLYINKDGKSKTRSTGFSLALKESGIDWNDLAQVASIDATAWQKITQISPENPMYLGMVRGERIADFARQLKNQGFNSVMDFLGHYDFNTNKILLRLKESGYFNDELLKRAQLTVRMINDAMILRNVPGITGTEKLTAMADYRVPQVFYNYGAVELNETLRGKLINMEPLESHSKEELAIRATVIVVAEKLSELMGMTEGDMDLLLWMYAGEKAKEMAIPHMLVATDEY